MNGAELDKYCVSPGVSVREVMAVIDGNRDGIALVVDEGGKLVGTITDGDIRRFILKGGSPDGPCSEVTWTKPITAPAGASSDKLLQLLGEHRLRSIPVVDADGSPRGLARMLDLLPHEKASHTAVIMAGGEGKRLRPLTDEIPKPMVEVGGRPILEGIIRNLAESGVTRLYVSVNYRSEVIENHFGDGADFGVKITYLREKEKLGTAGALSLLLEAPGEPFLVMNGDVVTNVSFNRLLEFHRDHRCAMCVAATEYNINIPFGVLDLAGHYVLGLEEKPSERFLCNAGIYVMEPELLRFVPKTQFFDMTDLLDRTVQEGLPVSAFPILEYWVDIGQEKDLRRARQDVEGGRKES